jgi:hypothetical protein
MAEGFWVNTMAPSGVDSRKYCSKKWYNREMKPGTTRMDKTFVRKGKLKDQGNDLEFWLSRPPEERLAALEQIRQEYNTWKYGPGQGFQRVYRIVKRK